MALFCIRQDQTKLAEAIRELKAPRRRWSIAFSAVSSLAAAVAAGLSAYSLHQQQTTHALDIAETQRAAIASQEQVYIRAYAQLRNHKGPNPLTVEGYQASQDVRFEAQIAAAMLVELAERMKLANDRRAECWRSFLPGLPGPLMDKSFLLEAYANDGWGRAMIKDARANLLANDTSVGYASAGCKALLQTPINHD